MTTTNLRLLASILLATVGLAATACGSTVTGGGDDDDDGSDDGVASTSSGGCAETFVGDCEHGGASCVDGAWLCPPPAEHCPLERPLSGSACEGLQSCDYVEEGFCGGDSVVVTFTCEDDVWSVPAYPRCSQPECPPDQPAVGSDCDVEGQSCVYEAFDCGQPGGTFTCEGGAWAVSDETFARCALPPCAEADDMDACTSWGCRWLEPGCGDEVIIALPAAGCFDPYACGEESCYGDEVCTQAMVLPDCVDEGCDACGQSELVCLPRPVDGGAR